MTWFTSHGRPAAENSKQSVIVADSVQTLSSGWVKKGLIVTLLFDR